MPASRSHVSYAMSDCADRSRASCSAVLGPSAGASGTGRRLRVIPRPPTGVPRRICPASSVLGRRRGTARVRHEHAMDGARERLRTQPHALATPRASWTGPGRHTVARVHQHGASVARSTSSIPSHIERLCQGPSSPPPGPRLFATHITRGQGRGHFPGHGTAKPSDSSANQG